ncbi:hypothetical protein LTR86_009854 [Recurvomyces mirabilis]|nr:hypothetical protein LTR86_009854 [Recurvomyces mirabilis]
MAFEDTVLLEYQGHIVKLSVINAARARMPARMLVHPVRESHEFLDLAVYSFLIESGHRDEKVLFDLGFMENLDGDMPPFLQALLAGETSMMSIDEIQHVPDQLISNGIALESINAAIWSHAHFDHVGSPAAFPSSTDLVVPNGLQIRCQNAEETDPERYMLSRAFKDRKVREIDFANSNTSIGGFRAIDFFRDGSFWLLDAPGHTVNHMCALARTTKDSWVLLAADACHNIASLRPSEFRPLPQSPTSYIQKASTPSNSALEAPKCMCSVYGLAPQMHEDLAAAERTLLKIKALDGRDDVIVILGHDATLLDVLPLFPRELGDWRAKGFADKARWLFLDNV